MNNNDMKLTLKNGTFSALQDDFDAVLNRTLGNMELKGADEATLTLKLLIKLEKRNVSMPEGDRDVTMPSFKHDISSIMQVKDRKSGQLNGELVLVYDPESGAYILRPLNDGQLRFDAEGNVVDSDGNEIRSEEETPKLTDSEFMLESRNETDEEIELPFGKDDDDIFNQEKADRDAALAAWLEKFDGKELTVTEAMGNYALRTVDKDVLVMSSAADRESVMFCESWLLKDYVGERLVCTAYRDDCRIYSIAIEAPDKGELVFEIEVPDINEINDNENWWEL